VSGQSDYFLVVANEAVNVPEIVFSGLDPIPTSIRFSTTDVLVVIGVEVTAQLTVMATYADDSDQDVTNGE